MLLICETLKSSYVTRLFYTITRTCQQKFNIKHQKFYMIKAAGHLCTQRPESYK